MEMNVTALKNRAEGAIARLRRGGGPPTVSQMWEMYARNRKGQEGVGDEWSNPALIGMDGISPDDIVPHLMDTYVRPFLGTPDRVIEIGSGGGRFTGALLDFSGSVIATDTAKSMIEILRERYADRPNLEPLLLDGTGLGAIADASVDAVFSYGVFVHLQHWDFYNYIAESARVLKPGGKAVIQHANTLSELGWKRFLHDVPVSLNRHKLGGTFTVMTPELMREFVERAGLVLDACRTDIATRDAVSFITKPA
jgi:SAM-dependent methyltransferase